jgi:3-phenylpropionate/trans-cinnamate dioxygenase ferredoxin reductase subunit
MTDGALIIGGGQAAVHIAVALRESGYGEPITLLSAEAQPPYQRPPLSKGFLAGTVDAASLELRTSAFYAQHRIAVISSACVEGLRLTDGTAGAGWAVTDDGRRFAFDRLALAVGARPRRLAVPGTELDGVHYLRSIEDADRLRHELLAADRVMVVGGGFIGLEVAAVARYLGKSVVVVEALDRLLSRSVAVVVSDFLRRAHAARGVEFLLGTTVSALHGANGRVVAAELSTGARRPVDLMLVGVGVVPRTELAEQIGLVCDRGIVVDGSARTSNPAIVAAGDCTVLPDPQRGEGYVRLESVHNAVSQARVAAASLVGRPALYREVPWFWSDQYDLKLQIAGLMSGYDRAVVRGVPQAGAFSVLYYRQGRLLGIHAVNRPADYLAVRRALTVSANIPASLAGNVERPLVELISN